jgi:hypothetical protein
MIDPIEVMYPFTDFANNAENPFWGLFWKEQYKAFLKLYLFMRKHLNTLEYREI